MKCMSYTCCRCMSLKTGCYLTGIVALVEGITKFAFGAILMLWATDNRSSNGIILALFCIIFAIAIAAAGVLLFIGTLQGTSKFIKIFIIIDILNLVFSTVAFFILVIYFVGLQWVCYITYFVADLYLIFVVFSYYND